MKFNFNNNKTNKTNLAIISKNHINYNEYYSLVQETARKLNISQFKSNEKAAIFAENNKSFLILFFAFLQIGVIVIPLNKSLPESQILKFLCAVNCNKIFVNDISKVNLPDSNIKLFQINEFIPNKISDFSTLKLKPIYCEQDSTIIFTSGSSGNPKAVLHTFGNHYFSTLGSNENIAFKSGDRWLISLPLYHVGGISILFRAMIGGSAVVIPDENLSIIENIIKYNITHISLVATQFMKLLEIKDSLNILKKLKCILIGGSIIPAQMIKKSIKYKLPIFTTYGSTEMASQITTTMPNEFSKNLFTSGRLLRYRELKIAEDGEILVKGKTLLKGFVEKNILSKPFDSDGWYHTGDLGNIDNEGYLTIIGRKDNMLISGGENIYPEEIEKYLMNINGIKEALVIDIPSEKFGARPVVLIKANNYKTINSNKIIKHLSEYLPKFKIPDSFYKWPNNQYSIKPNRTDFKNQYKNYELKEIL